jgi:fatty acid desaturase
MDRHEAMVAAATLVAVAVAVPAFLALAVVWGMVVEGRVHELIRILQGVI